jgi:hypothetical protein
MNLSKLDTPVLLIGGTGRSGTTIFRKIIEQHPDVATIPEWRLLTDPEGIVEYLKILENGNPFMLDQAYRRLVRFISDLQEPHYFSRLLSHFEIFENMGSYRLTSRYFGVNAEKSLPGFCKLSSEFLEALVDFRWYGQYAGLKQFQNKEIVHVIENVEAVEAICRNFLAQIAVLAMEQSNKKRFLEKNTWSLLHFDKVSRLYPTSKMVHIHRDPRDVVASYVKQPWMPSDPVQCAKILMKLMDLWWHARGLVIPDRYLEISLHDLVNNTEEVQKKVCSFWEIEYVPELLDMDLSGSNDGRWKKELNQEQRVQVEIILESVLSHYGYDKE